MKNGAAFLFYFLYFAALSAFMPYIVLYYTALGLPGAQIGVLSSLGPLITLVAGPLWSGLADARSRHRLVLSLNGLTVAAVVLLFPLAGGFGGLLVLGSLFALFLAPLPSLADSAVMFMLRGDGGKYGRLRVGGSAGWGVFAPLIGLMIERDGQHWIFWGLAGLMVLAVLAAQFLVYPRPEVGAGAQTTSASRPTSFWQGLRILLADRRWVVVLTILFFGGVGLSSLNTYLLLHMQTLGASQSLMGLTMTLATISEVPALFFVNRLTGRFSPRGLLLLAMGALSLRLLLTGFATGPIWALATQAIHGLTFPVFWVAGVAFAHKNAPAGLSATAQGVMGTVFMGLGSAVGAFLGGLMITPFGVHSIFLGYGAMSLLVLFFFFAFTRSQKMSL